MSRERVDARLAPLERLGIRLDLAPMRQLLAAAGDPQLAVPVVLVAGTNGKGSTAAMLAAIATAAGLRTGLATSPHLERVEERIRFDGEPIDPSRLAPLLDRLLECAAAAGLAPPTYFEVTTAAAFLAFAADPVDLAIVEVGLGGRLDAANAAEPILSLITPIALDHTEWLGTTLAAVATEKAGILRAGRPVVLARQDPEAAAPLAAAARRVGALPVAAADRVTVERVEDLGLAGSRLSVRLDGRPLELALPLAGAHQADNATTALAAALVLAATGFPAIDAGAMHRGLAAVRWPGRLETIALPDGTEVLLDAAHNPHGAAALAATLARLGEPYVLLFGALADKQVGGMLPPLADGAAAIVLARPDSPRALDPAILAAGLDAGVEVRVEPEPRAALAAALDLARRQGLPRVVACGSIYLIGTLRAHLRELAGVAGG